MTLDDLGPDRDEEFEPLGVHQGADELPKRNYDIDHELVIDTVPLVADEKAKFPTDDMLDAAVDDMQDKWEDECFSYHWVDEDELHAWHSGKEVDRVQPEFRKIKVICKMNSKYRTNSAGEPAKWLRALSGQGNLGTMRRLIEKADESLNEIGMGAHGVTADDFNIVDFSYLNAIPQDQTPIWQEFLMERDDWLEQ